MSSPVSQYVFLIYHYGGARPVVPFLIAHALSRSNVESRIGDHINGSVREGVKKLIVNAAVVVAFLTRDVSIGNGRYYPSQWTHEELIWALANNVPCVLVIESGVELDDGLTGELKPIVLHVDTMDVAIKEAVAQVDIFLAPPSRRPSALSEGHDCTVARRLMEAEEDSSNYRHQSALELLKPLLPEGDWRISLRYAAVLLRSGRVSSATDIFSGVAKDFEAVAPALAEASYWLGKLAQRQSVLEASDRSAFSMSEELFRRSLKASSDFVPAIACLILCLILQRRHDEASRLLRGELSEALIEALREETSFLGPPGIQLILELSDAEWLFPLLFPSRRK